MKQWKKEEVMYKDLLSVEQAAAYSGRSVASIRQWVFNELIPYQRDEFGYRIMMKRTDVDKRLEEIERYKNRGKDEETELNLEAVAVRKGKHQ